MGMLRALTPLLSGGMLIVLLGQPLLVRDIPDPSCLDGAGDDYNVEASNDGSRIDFSGIKSLLWVANPNADCSRVSSLAALRASNRFVEWGWILGYDRYGSYQGRPNPFYCWQTPVMSQSECLNPSEQFSGGQNITFTLQDSDHDTVWSVYLYSSGTFKGSMDVDFYQATLLTNGERDSAESIPWSHFQDLKRLPTSSSSYGSWTNLELYYDTDPDYRCREVTATEHYVERATTNQC